MPDGVFVGFDFGYRRIGVAVGQKLTGSASPLPTLLAKEGIPDWGAIEKILREWRPQALIVGLPTKQDDTAFYTTDAAKRFSEQLKSRFSLTVHMVDERLTTVEARGRLFEIGGYRKIKQTEIDSLAACIILEQWLQAFKPI